jgi:hypothetical protein
MPVFLEAGTKRTFASAVEWPGWSRSGRSEDDALAALAAYGERYAEVASRAKLPFTVPADPSAFDVVERLAGGSGTDFGIPTLGPRGDDREVPARELARLEALLRASWDLLDRAARSARGIELRKGPRGGGRDLQKIVAHVTEAEESYLVQLGTRRPKAARTSAALREAILEALRARAEGRPLAEPNAVRKPWSPRYFVRRAAWHVLDHAWEIQDRASPAR